MDEASIREKINGVMEGFFKVFDSPEEGVIAKQIAVNKVAIFFGYLEKLYDASITFEGESYRQLKGYKAL